MSSARNSPTLRAAGGDRWGRWETIKLLLLLSACSNMCRGRRGHDIWPGRQKPSRLGDGTLHTDDVGREGCEILSARYHFINKIVGRRGNFLAVEVFLMGLASGFSKSEVKVLSEALCPSFQALCVSQRIFGWKPTAFPPEPPLGLWHWRCFICASSSPPWLVMYREGDRGKVYLLSLSHALDSHFALQTKPDCSARRKQRRPAEPHRALQDVPACPRTSTGLKHLAFQESAGALQVRRG